MVNHWRLAMDARTMTTSFDRWSFLGVLASESVTMYLAPDGSLRSRGRVADPEVAAFIRLHREKIIRELLTPR